MFTSSPGFVWDANEKALREVEKNWREHRQSLILEETRAELRQMGSVGKQFLEAIEGAVVEQSAEDERIPSGGLDVGERNTGKFQMLSMFNIARRRQRTDGNNDGDGDGEKTATTKATETKASETATRAPTTTTEAMMDKVTLPTPTLSPTHTQKLTEKVTSNIAILVLIVTMLMATIINSMTRFSSARVN